MRSVTSVLKVRKARTRVVIDTANLNPQPCVGKYRELGLSCHEHTTLTPPNPILHTGKFHNFEIFKFHKISRHKIKRQV